MNWGYSKKKQQSYVKKPVKSKLNSIRSSTRPKGKQLKSTKPVNPHGKPVARLSGAIKYSMHDAVLNANLVKEKLLLQRISRHYGIPVAHKKVKFLDSDGNLYLEKENRHIPNLTKTWNSLDSISRKIAFEDYVLANPPFNEDIEENWAKYNYGDMEFKNFPRNIQKGIERRWRFDQW